MCSWFFQWTSRLTFFQTSETTGNVEIPHTRVIRFSPFIPLCDRGKPKLYLDCTLSPTHYDHQIQNLQAFLYRLRQIY